MVQVTTLLTSAGMYTVAGGCIVSGAILLNSLRDKRQTERDEYKEIKAL